MKLCKVCSIGIGEYLKVKNRYSKLCKVCFKHNQKEKHDFWYYNKPKKTIQQIKCKVCGSIFTPKTKAIYCSDKCRLKARQIQRKLRWQQKGK